MAMSGKVVYPKYLREMPSIFLREFFDRFRRHYSAKDLREYIHLIVMYKKNGAKSRQVREKKQRPNIIGLMELLQRVSPAVRNLHDEYAAAEFRGKGANKIPFLTDLEERIGMTEEEKESQPQMKRNGGQEEVEAQERDNDVDRNEDDCDVDAGTGTDDTTRGATTSTYSDVHMGELSSSDTPTQNDGKEYSWSAHSPCPYQAEVINLLKEEGFELVPMSLYQIWKGNEEAGKIDHVNGVICMDAGHFRFRVDDRGSLKIFEMGQNFNDVKVKVEKEKQGGEVVYKGVFVKTRRKG